MATGEREECNRMWDAYCLTRWTEDKHYRDYGRHSYPLQQKILALRNAYRDRWGTMDTCALVDTTPMTDPSKEDIIKRAAEIWKTDLTAWNVLRNGQGWNFILPAEPPTRIRAVDEHASFPLYKMRIRSRRLEVCLENYEWVPVPLKAND